MINQGYYYEHPKQDATEESKKLCPECGKIVRKEAISNMPFFAHKRCLNCHWESKPWRFAFS